MSSVRNLFNFTFLLIVDDGDDQALFCEQTANRRRFKITQNRICIFFPLFFPDFFLALLFFNFFLCFFQPFKSSKYFFYRQLLFIVTLTIIIIIIIIILRHFTPRQAKQELRDNFLKNRQKSFVAMCLPPQLEL